MSSNNTHKSICLGLQIYHFWRSIYTNITPACRKQEYESFTFMDADTLVASMSIMPNVYKGICKSDSFRLC